MLLITPVGDVDLSLLDWLRGELRSVFNEEVRVGAGMPVPRESFFRERRQYLAPFILDRLKPPPGDSRVLAVTDVDIFAPGLNFIFGQADLGGRRAIISVARLRPEFYSLPPDRRLLRERTLKEAVHELGHTYGLGHCRNPECVMYFSNSLADTDRKSASYCQECMRQSSLKPRLTRA